jgi:hypothetical protein
MNKYASLFSVFVLLLVFAAGYFLQMPQTIEYEDQNLANFSTKRAFKMVEKLTKEPHYVGSANHDVVLELLVQELKTMGIFAQVQEGYTMSDWGNLVLSKNVIGRIKGTNSDKALLLLSHYDSAPHSFSHGAGDDASGVATILEGVRAFLQAKTPHKNDIIIVFSDAEELGLNGAALFVTQHPWAKEVGLALNFEARGSSGPSYMLMETNKGNAGLVSEFSKAGVTYPVSNSLMYSIYKMLPNDTDLTVFREKGNIQGLNFAFIDDHFNYHTQQDDAQHLAKNTLAHQGRYLMPLLTYFSNANLDAVQATEDEVYFTIPFTFISYPFSWVLPMTIIAAVFFVLFLFIVRVKRVFSFSELFKGLVPLAVALILAGGLTYFGWIGLLWAYPQYNDLLNGFTYNGHDYIAAFVALSLSICFLMYHWLSSKKVIMNHYVMVLMVWLVINGLVANVLPGAGFLIIPVYFGLIAFGAFVLTQRSNRVLNLICGIPAVLLLAPFIQMFPVGLGLKILFGSAILTVLTFGLLLPVFGAFNRKGSWAFGLFVLSLLLFAKGHYNSGYEAGKAKSNSLVYLYNADTNQAFWVTYDKNLDDWTKTYLGSYPKSARVLNDMPLVSKYNSGFTYATTTDVVSIKKPLILFAKDSLSGNLRYVQLKIIPNRKVNRYDIFANEAMTFYNFRANGAKNIGDTSSMLERKGKKLLSYYVVNNAPLVLDFIINASAVIDMELLESSFDLLENPLFNIQPRENWMMPSPFVLNDAVVIRKKIKKGQQSIPKEVVATVADSLAVAKDSLKDRWR